MQRHFRARYAAVPRVVPLSQRSFSHCTSLCAPRRAARRVRRVEQMKLAQIDNRHSVRFERVPNLGARLVENVQLRGVL